MTLEAARKTTTENRILSADCCTAYSSETSFFDLGFPKQLVSRVICLYEQTERNSIYTSNRQKYIYYLSSDP